MSSVGEILRRERLRRNLELDQISRELRISSRFLEAIEEERFDKLPAAVFAKSFVRQYARLLELDEEELASEVQRVVEPPPLETDARNLHIAPIADIHVPRVERWDTVGDERRFEWSSWLPSLGLVIVVMLVCSGVYAFFQRSRRPVTAQTAPPFHAVATGSAGPQTQAAPVQQTEQAPPPVQTAPSPAPPPPPSRIQSADRQPMDARPSSANGSGAVHVQLTAQEPVWVLARADGKYLFSGTLEPNETRSVDANGALLLRLGNAGGVNIVLNGKPLGAVGPKGQVRDVQLTSGGFQIVPAGKSAEPDEPI